MRVSYYANFEEVCEWICLNHEGFAKQRADEWMAKRELDKPGRYPIDCYECHCRQGFILEERVFCNECGVMIGSPAVAKDNVEAALWRCYREPVKILMEKDGEWMRIRVFRWEEEVEPGYLQLDDEVIF